MYLSIRKLIFNIILPDMLYLKKYNEIVELCEVDLSRLHEYKDYVHLPYIEKENIYDAFLDVQNLFKEKEELHVQEDFDTAFRTFIEAWDASYYNFMIEYLKPVAIEWCDKNKIHYEIDV